jgi:hypothetical protein
MRLKAVLRVLAATGVLSTLLGTGLAAPTQATNLRFADPAIAAVWTRTDSVVAAGQAQRSWYWGPTPGMILREPYADAPGGTRLVQYFDKSRMEINNPGGDRTSKFFVTNGLLSIELISGKVAVGNNKYETRTAATIPLASDGDDPFGPTYASFAPVSNTPLGDHPAPDRTNSFATATIDRASKVGDDPSKAQDPTRLVHYEPLTQHNVPKVFWTFLNQVGPVRVGSTTGNALLSDPWTFTTGLPISEAYWADVQIAGQRTAVLIQAYERRVLTYIPTYAPAWQVQMNNAGQQYYAWRYGGPAALLADSLTRMDNASSYHASSVMELAANGRSVRFAVQEADFAAPNKVYIKQSAVSLAGTIDSEVITIGATGWVSATDTAHVWVPINPADVGADPSALNMAALIGVLQYAGNLQALGDETVDGVAATHQRMTLDPAAIPSVQGLTWSAATGEVWIAKDTRYLHKVRANLTLGPGAVTTGQVVVTVTFRDFGKPVTIQPPR